MYNWFTPTSYRISRVSCNLCYLKIVLENIFICIYLVIEPLIQFSPQLPSCEIGLVTFCITFTSLQWYCTVSIGAVIISGKTYPVSNIGKLTSRKPQPRNICQIN
jgi:hypothetical protein